MVKALERIYRKPEGTPRQKRLHISASPAELVDVSLATAHIQADPLTELSQEHSGNERIQLLVIELGLRLNRYLQTTVETNQGTEIRPSAYATALFELFQLPANERVQDPRWAEIHEIDRYIRPEVTLLLQQLRAELNCSAQELLQRLRSNRADGRSIATIFSYWQRLEPFKLEAQELPARIIIMNPLDINNPSTERHWTERGKHLLGTGHDSGLPNLIEMTRLRTLDTLEMVAETTPAVGEACQVIQQWMEERIGSIRVDASTEAFGYYTSQMDFMQLDPSKSIPLLNALAILKQECPTVYLRLVGIAPEGHLETGEAQRSDLFGSPVQLALYRLGQHADLPPMLRDYAEQLTKINVAQTPLAYIDDERFKHISRQLAVKDFNEREAGSTGVSSAVLGAIMLVRPEVVRAYQLQQEMRTMMEVAERENIVEIAKVIRIGSRREIINILCKTSNNLLQAEPIKAAMRVRISEASFRGLYDPAVVNAPETRKNYFKTTLLWEIQRHQDRSYGHVPGDQPVPGELSLTTDLYAELWMTAPESLLLSDEFVDDVIMCMDYPSMTTVLLKTLQTHAITAEQWSHSVVNTAILNYDSTDHGSGLRSYIEERLFNYQQRSAIERKKKLIVGLIRLFKATPLSLLWDKKHGPTLGAFYAGVDSEDLRRAAAAEIGSTNFNAASSLLVGGDNSGVCLGYHQLISQSKDLLESKAFTGGHFRATRIVLQARLGDGLIDTQSLLKANEESIETMMIVSNMMTATERANNIKLLEKCVARINQQGSGTYAASQWPARDAMVRWVEIFKAEPIVDYSNVKPNL